MIAAASNDGESGAFTVGTPSVGKGVYSVASFDNNHSFFKVFEVNNKFYSKYQKKRVFCSFFFLPL